MATLCDRLMVPILLDQLRTICYIVLPQVMLSTRASKAQQVFELMLVGLAWCSDGQVSPEPQTQAHHPSFQVPGEAGSFQHPCKASNNRHEIHHVGGMLAGNSNL